MAEETETGGPEVRFQPTAWTVVREARAGSPEAMERLIAVIWKPVYFFIRRRGHDVESAKDLTQSFFAVALDKDFLKDVAAEKGRFRSYILAAVSHFLSNAYDRAKAKKRGGDFAFVRAEAEMPSGDPTPEAAFRSKWALEILARAIDRLRGSVAAEDLALLRGDPRPDLTPTDRKHRLYRLRMKLRAAFREELLPSVDREEDVESEVRELFSALGKQF